MEYYIFVNGYIKDYDIIKNILKKDSFFIACDGGLGHLDKLGINPNLLIGDFDSIDLNILSKYSEVEKLEYPTDKDFTDLELALEYLKKIKVKSAYILGGTGGRLDHTLGNIFLLKKFYEYGIELKIIDEIQEIFFIKGSKNFTGYEGKYLSIIPLEDIVCHSSFGLKYQLENLSFTLGDTLSISNIVVDDFVEIKLKKGCGLVIINKEV
ncbi:MAG: thiamine diphosphokinase [Lachnospirales bacterium]